MCQSVGQHASCSFDRVSFYFILEHLTPWRRSNAAYYFCKKFCLQAAVLTGLSRRNLKENASVFSATKQPIQISRQNHKNFFQKNVGYYPTLIDLNLICVSQKLIFQSLWPYMPTAQAASVQLIVRQLAEVEQLCSLSRVPTQQTVSGLNKCNKMNISNLTMLCNIQRGLRNNLRTSPYNITDQCLKKKIGPEGVCVGGGCH